MSEVKSLRMSPEQCPYWDCVTQICTLSGGDCEPGTWDVCFYRFVKSLRDFTNSNRKMSLKKSKRGYGFAN